MKTTFALILLFLGFTLYGQKSAQSGKIVNRESISDNYNRVSLTYLLLDVPTGSYYDMMKQAFSRVSVADKYDDNTIGNPFIKPSSPNLNSYEIKTALVSGHYVNSVIAKWFSRKADGSFGVETLHQRGLYNATDADVLNAGADKRGLAKIKDMGEKLVNNSFIIVYKIDDLIDMNEYYNRQQQKSKTLVNRYKNGFVANVTAYVYQLDFNEPIKNEFFEKLWADPGEVGIGQKKEAFDRFEFPVTSISSSTVLMESSQWNPGYSTSPLVQASREDMMFGLVQGGINNSLTSLEEKFGQFKVTASIFNTWPFRAKIGKKEGLKKDDRYFVYEMEQDRNGKIVGRRKGVIRASKIADNRQVATGQSQLSNFYQVGGQNIKKGMQLQQSHDAGGTFSIGGSEGGVSGLDARLEINMTQLIWSQLPTMTKFYIEGAFQPATFKVNYTTSGTTTYNYFLRYGFGLGKEFCFLRNLRLQPFAGAGFEELSSLDDSKMTLKSLYIHPGFIFAINLKYNIQLIWQFSDYMMDSSIMDKDNKAMTISGAATWGQAWNRGGITNTFGIRFEL